MSFHQQKPPKIIIVGAGAAGIAAASRFLQNGLSDLIILEAENRIGGRVLSVEFAGSIVDLGGQWCHGEKGNIVYEMVKDLDLLQTSKNNYQDNTYYLSDGSVLDKTITDRLFKVFCTLMEDDQKIEKSTEESLGGYFLREYQKSVQLEFGDDKKAEQLSPIILDWFRKFTLCLDSSSTWYDVALSPPNQYRKCDGDQQLNWKNKGYVTILDVLTKKIPDPSKKLPIDDKIFLNKEVNRIVWDGNTVNPEGVTVECADGSSYNADHVILTVSTGVLKNLQKKFVPALPLEKQEQIDTLTVGAIGKILLKFPEKWWPEDLKGFSLVWTDEDRKNILKEFPEGPSYNGRSWLEDIFGFYVIDSHPQVLLGWIIGKMVQEVEELSDELVTKGCLYLLRKFVGQKYKIPEPHQILRSKWKSNPHFNGTYTYIPLEATRKNITLNDLSKPVLNSQKKQVVLFAGEGTHPNFYSTVHGAIETGFREADRILNVYSSHYKVVIIGAGMAGLGAAKTLHELGCKDVIILEAQEYAGGRIKTIQWENRTFELGAQWIHGRENPLYKLAAKYNLLSEITSEEGLGQYVRPSGEIIDDYLVKKVDFQIGKFLAECENFHHNKSLADYPESVEAFLRARFAEYLRLEESGCDSEDVQQIKWELFDWHLRFQVIDNSCLDMGKLSARGWGKYVCVDDKAHINLKCGYSQLVEILLASLPENSVSLSTPVTEINYTNQKVVVIGLENGAKLTCDHLIITPSLGVLKSSGFHKHNIKTNPPWPESHRNSIAKLGFHAIGKVFLIYEDPWWSQEEQGFQLVWGKDFQFPPEESWLQFCTGFDAVYNQPDVLLCWVGGPGVQQMENLNEQEIAQHCTNILRTFLPNRQISVPVKVIRTRWLSNPWIRGGYSNISSDCDESEAGMRQLSEPLFVDDDGKPRILMAGEAVHESHYSTTHGAYESGQNQARYLASHIFHTE